MGGKVGRRGDKEGGQDTKRTMATRGFHFTKVDTIPRMAATIFSPPAKARIMGAAVYTASDRAP